MGNTNEPTTSHESMLLLDAFEVRVSEYMYQIALKHAVETRNEKNVNADDVESMKLRVESALRAMLIDTRVDPECYYSDEEYCECTIPKPHPAIHGCGACGRTIDTTSEFKTG